MIEYFLIGLAIADLLILWALWRIIALLSGGTGPWPTRRRSDSDDNLDNRW